ncbi:hypothetical protein PYCC9005_003321 [Savitreella phatthalungensis]
MAARVHRVCNTAQTASDMARSTTPEHAMLHDDPQTPINHAVVLPATSPPLDLQLDGAMKSQPMADSPMSAMSSQTTIAGSPTEDVVEKDIVKSHRRNRSSVQFHGLPAAGAAQVVPRHGSDSEIVPVNIELSDTTEDKWTSEASKRDSKAFFKLGHKKRNSQIQLPHDVPGIPIQATYIGEKRQYGSLGRKYRNLRYTQSAICLITFVLLIIVVAGVSPFTYTVFFFEWFLAVVTFAQLWLYFLPFCIWWNRSVAKTNDGATPDRKTGRGKKRYQIAHDDWCMLILDFCASGSGVIAVYAAVCRSVRCAIRAPGVWDFITDGEFDVLRPYYQRHSGVCPTWHITLVFEIVLTLMSIIAWFTTLARIVGGKKRARRESIALSRGSTADRPLIVTDLEKQAARHAPVFAESQSSLAGTRGVRQAADVPSARQNVVGRKESETSRLSIPSSSFSAIAANLREASRSQDVGQGSIHTARHVSVPAIKPRLMPSPLTAAA